MNDVKLFDENSESSEGEHDHTFVGVDSKQLGVSEASATNSKNNEQQFATFDNAKTLDNNKAEELNDTLQHAISGDIKTFRAIKDPTPPNVGSAMMPRKKLY